MIPIFVMVLSFVVLLGWMLSIPAMTTFGGPVPMVPTTALCILTMAIIESLRQRECKGYSHWWQAVAAGLTSAVAIGALVTLYESPGIGVWLWAVTPSARMPNARMADSTAIALLLLCVAQWTGRAGRLVIMGMLIMIVGIVIIWPTSFGVDEMAVPTMIALLGLSTANRLKVLL